MMNDGAITFSTALDNSELEKELQSTMRKIDKLNKKAVQQQSERMPLVEQAKQLGAELDIAKAKLYELQSAPKGTVATGQLSEQKEYVKELQTEWNKVNNRVDRYDTTIKNTALALEAEKTSAGQLEAKLSATGAGAQRMGAAVSKAGDYMERFSKKIKTIVKQVFVFTMITTALRSLQQWFGKIVNSDSEAAEAMAKLRAALLVMVQPLIDVIIPAFIKFIGVLSQVVMAIARFVAMLFGTTTEQSKKNAKSLHNQSKEIKGIGVAAQKAGKQLASFDEINTLSDDKERGGTGAVYDAPLSFSGLDEFDTQQYKNKIDELTVYISGALLALGALLTFSGINIPLGLGLMAAGAVGLVAEAKENWNAADGKIKGAINLVLLTLAGAGLVIGAILALSGANLPLGLGLMALGATALGAAVAINWRSMDKDVKIAIAGLLKIVGTSLLVLGAVLAFSGANIPLGIGIMAAGGASLASAVALNWDMLKEDVKRAVADILLMVSTALLVLGAVLALSGANIPLGIALLAASAVGLVASVALNWEKITGEMRGPVTQILKLVGTSLLAFGAILVFSGANIPLGIGMMIAGGASLASAVALNWDFVLDKIKGAWNSIKTWWKLTVAPKFTLEYWKNLFSCIGEGFTARIKDAVNGGVSLLNRFIDWVNEKLNISWDGLSLFGKEIFPSGDFQLFKIPHIPALAQGAVIPPNREFLAVLGDQKSGTNIETPLATMVQAFESALDKRGGGGALPAINFYMDGRKIAGYTVEHINRMARTSNKVVLNV